MGHFHFSPEQKILRPISTSTEGQISLKAPQGNRHSKGWNGWVQTVSSGQVTDWVGVPPLGLLELHGLQVDTAAQVLQLLQLRDLVPWGSSAGNPDLPL